MEVGDAEISSGTLSANRRLSKPDAAAGTILLWGLFDGTFCRGGNYHGNRGSRKHREVISDFGFPTSEIRNYSCLSFHSSYHAICIASSFFSFEFLGSSLKLSKAVTHLCRSV